MRLAIVLLGLLIGTSVWSEECADLKNARTESFGTMIGARDNFFHVEIIDPVWAKTIFGSALSEKSNVDLFVTEIKDGKLNVYMSGRRIGYFDIPGAQLEDHKTSSGVILLYVANGMEFRFRYNFGIRRRVELWVDGLTGPRKSRKILTAMGGLEEFAL